MASFKLIGGPGKWDLMLALFDNTLEKPRSVQFKATKGSCEPGEMKKLDIEKSKHYEFKCIINSISREDGSGESWNIDGYITNIDFDGGCYVYYDSRNHFTACFHTVHRHGTMDVKVK